MRSALALLTLAAVSVSAQVANYTSELDMKVSPGTVDPSTRRLWCRAQYDTCKTLCATNFNDNDCSEDDLSYKCTCSSNNSAPGLQYYTQTMPTFICNELLAQCIAENTQSSRDQDDCKKNIGDLCGTITPPTLSSEKSSSAAAGASSTSSHAATATSESVATTSSKALAAPTMMPAAGHGAFALAVGVMAYML